MLEDEAYRSLWNLLETIPDRDDPARSARQAIIDFNELVKTGRTPHRAPGCSSTKAAITSRKRPPRPPARRS
jgi:hypothetical protein